MWRFFRKSLLLLLTAVLGLVAGIIIRFAFGRGLQWSSPAPATTQKPDAVSATADASAASPGAAPPAANPAHCTAVEQLTAIANGDAAALERMVQAEWDMALETGQNGQEFDRLLMQLIALEPLRAMAWAKRNVFGSLGQTHIFEVWREQDRAAAEAWAGANAPELLAKPLPPKLTEEELTRMLKDDPSGLEALFTTDANLFARTAKLRAQQDPAAALAWAQSLKSGARQSTAIKHALEAMAQRDPAAAAEAWKSLPKGEAAREAFGKIESALPKDQAIAWMKSLDQSQMVRTALAKRLPDGPEREALLATLPPGASDTISAGTKLFQAIRNGPSPQAFAALAEAAGKGANADENIAGVLFKQDPAGTLAALSALPEGQFKSGAVTHIGEWLADLPESEAMQRFAGMPPGMFKDKAAENLALRLNNKSPQEALAFLQQQSPEARSQALPEVMQKWFSQDPAAARTQWESLPEPDRRAASAELSQQFANSPTPEKMALLTTLPEVPPEVYKDATANWVARAPEQASAWVNALPAGAQRDAAVGSMVSTLTLRDWDPERAVVWAGTIGDEAQRLASLRTSLELWSLRDPAAAQTALQLLSPADQQALTTP